jgi:peptide/nickel transport system permease protein
MEGFLMLSFLARRIVWAVLVLWLVMSGVFLLVHVVGDPARATLGEKAGAEQLAAFRHKHGLDRPLAQRYSQYLIDLATLDLGTSFQDEEPVLSLIAQRLPRTLLLGAMALTLELMFGLLVGIVAAVRRNSWFDTSVMALAIVGISMPTFVTGLWFLSYFAFRLGLFPMGGYGVTFVDHLRHGFLPALTLAVVGAATYARVMRGEMIEALRSDYVRTARAKGLSELRVVVMHAGRNALLPVVTMVGISLRILVSGAIITEAIFGWPGMGRLAVEAISGLDLPVVMGIVFIACTTVQVGNVLADLAVAALDPRVRGAD